MTTHRHRAAGLAALAALLAATAPAAAGLPEYVARPEPAFAWSVRQRTEQAVPPGTVYDLKLTSQTWQGITWEHRLMVYLPRGVKPAASMLLLNTGGDANSTINGVGLALAQKIGAPVAVLFQIPNQPLFDGKKEDALIAETFVRFLDGKGQDESWPLLFPMVKSVVKAMDALQAFAKEEWKQPVEHFVITGASKRGWTTWLTGAADPRVKAIAPMVIDTLNMRDQMAHQLESYGRYSDMIHNYVERGLVPVPDTVEAKRLWTMIDPFLYRDRLTMPKLIVNGANDPYWTVDALNLYWGALKGDKWVLIVPNAGHDLREVPAGGRKELLPARMIDTVAAFTRSQIFDKPLPKLTWQHDDAGGQLRLTVESSAAPKAARLWVADAPTRDFRQSTWAEHPAAVTGGRAVGSVAPPATGFRAVYGEAEYEWEGLTLRLSTQVRVAAAAGK
jgi:PhoPQ-activated pathogenicity-related protein